MNSIATAPRIRDTPPAPVRLIEQAGAIFESLFERSAEAIWLLDPDAMVFLDCNNAAVELLRAPDKQQMLMATPSDVSPPFQPDGSPTRDKSIQITAYVQEHKTHRFEWLGRRFDGVEVPLEVSSTAISLGGRNIHVVMARDISERKRAESDLRESEQKFREVFEASTDAISIFDPQTRSNIACNEATVKLLGGPGKEWFLKQPVEALSPERQPDGRYSRDVGKFWVERAMSQGPQRFEWFAKRVNGEEFPVEILLTPMRLGGKLLLVTVSRDISERKRAEQALLESKQSLERRVIERTAELTTSEARFRALVEHAPEAIIVYSVETGRFLFGNQHACDLYGVTMDQLAQLTPVDVSPEFQPGGGRSVELTHEKIKEVLDGGIAVFEWVHKKSDGRLFPCEIRLLRLPAENQNLIRASIIDNTERKRADRALRESEAMFRALFEGASQGVVLHDENQILEANPAAVRILGRSFASEVLGRHPAHFSPPFQPNGASSDELARKNIDECVTRGSARFDWMGCAPDGRLIPLEVMLTRIEWSGRQVIQAFITDISERKKAEAELRASEARLRESEARFSVAFRASPALIGILRSSDGKHVLANDALLNWLGQRHEDLVGRTCLELGMWEDPSERDSVLCEMQSLGSVRQRECRWRNRRGECLTVLLSIETIILNDTPHMLTMALDISHRKRVEEELRASEGRLRESEARFRVAFEASPMFINILRMSDRKYVWANDAFVNRLGYSRDEVLGCTSANFGMWENSIARDLAWKDMRYIGSIRQRECRWRNRRGEPFTVLLSAETIQFNGEPHILSLALDITDRKRAEEELLRTLEREKELSQLKSNFVSMVSHEFRTPLGIIQSSAELLRDFHGRMSLVERDEQLESVTRNTRRMAGMMEEVLVLSRLDAGKLDFQPARLDLHAFCRRVVDEVISATNHRCPIDLSMDSVPEDTDADERLLGHIFNNLLSNAIKYSEPGFTVRFSVQRDGLNAVCIFRDQGIGISEADQQQLFKAFHRGSNVGTRPGTGLGLLLVKRCTDLHGGTIGISSRIGEGTTVTITLPIFSKTP